MMILADFLSMQIKIIKRTVMTILIIFFLSYSINNQNQMMNLRNMETREHEAFVSSGTHAEWQDEPLNDILAKVNFF